MSTRSYRQYCGLAAALDVVGTRWALLIVRDLEPGPRRFTDLFTALPGIATDVLAERLRALEAAGAVQQARIRYPSPSTVYELTPRGHELATIARSLARWGAPLLPATPDESMRTDPRWALQSMVLGDASGVADGCYVFEIGDEQYTVTVSGASARVTYGPPAHEPMLWVRCAQDAFFRLARTGSAQGVALERGTRRMLTHLVRALPLEVGAAGAR